MWLASGMRLLQVAFKSNIHVDNTRTQSINANFNVAVAQYSYMFRLLQGNHHQAEHQKCKKEIILHLTCGRDLGF